MITVKQILEQYSLVSDKATEEEIKLYALSEAGIFESSKLPMIRRSLKKNINEMTEAERKTLKSLLESLMDHTLLNEKSMSYPSDKDMPTVIILQRKAIRVFPDNQKIGLYYSQALDRYISIPFGPNIKDLSPQLNEESYAERKAKREEEKKEQQKLTGRRIVSLISKQRERQSPAAKLTTSVPSVGSRKVSNVDQKSAMPWGNREVIAITPEMRQQAGQKYIDNQQTLARIVGASVGAKLAMAAEKTPLRSKTTTIIGKPLKESFRNNLNQIREQKQLNEVSWQDIKSGAKKAAEFAGDVTGISDVASAVGKAREGDYSGAAWDAAKGIGKGAATVATGGIASAGVRGAIAAARAAKYAKTGNKIRAAATAGKKGFTRSKGWKLARGIGKVAAGAAGIGAAALGGLAGGNENIKDTTSREYGFGRLDIQKSAPQSATLTGGTLIGAQQQAQVFGKIPGTPRQPVYESIKNIVERNISNHTLQIDEETISINKSVAKKIVKLHESLNRTNQKKLEKMLNEDIVSFRKVINFALKQ